METYKGWSILERKPNGDVVIANGDIRKLLVYDKIPAARQKSGWYILREWNDKTMYWVDRAKPGWGVTYWISNEAADALGLGVPSIRPESQEGMYKSTLPDAKKLNAVKMLLKHRTGVDIEAVDVDALFDPKLSITENVRGIMQKLSRAGVRGRVRGSSTPHYIPLPHGGQEFWVQITSAGTAKDLSGRDDLVLVTDSQDVRAILQYLGNHEEVQQLGGFFVKVEGGDYTELYGFSGVVPYLDKPIYRITWGLRPRTSAPRPPSTAGAIGTPHPTKPDYLFFAHTQDWMTERLAAAAIHFIKEGGPNTFDYYIIWSEFEKARRVIGR